MVKIHLGSFICFLIFALDAYLYLSWGFWFSLGWAMLATVFLCVSLSPCQPDPEVPEEEHKKFY